MKIKGTTLAIVSNEEEAKSVLKINVNGENVVFIATTLEAELYLASIIGGYKNPLYEIIDKLRPNIAQDYTFYNFRIADNFCQDEPLTYIRDRLGYFLAELDRSIHFATEAIKKFRPNLLIIGEIKDFPGLSVVNGTLKNDAFLLLAKEKAIPYRLIGITSRNFSFKQMLGRSIQFMRYLKKQRISYESDLLILATPRHLVQMAPIIKEIKNKGISVSILTYSVTIALKGLLDKEFPGYFEKERLIGFKIKRESRKTKNNLLNMKVWAKFSHVRYKNNPLVVNYMRDKIFKIITSEMPEILNDVALANKVLSRIHPKALLVTTDPDSKVLPYINKAKENRMKTICIQHGAFHGKDSPAIFPVSDYFIVWSKVSKNILDKVEYFKKVRFIIGKSPFHHRRKILKTRVLENTKHLKILYLTALELTEKGYVNLFRKRLFDLVSSLNMNVTFLIRIYPYEKPDDFYALAKYSRLKIEFVNKITLEKAINLADLVIYENTTAGFDAMLAGKPTIYFNPYTRQDFFETVVNCASFPVLNKKDLNVNLAEFIKHKKEWLMYSKNGQVYAEQYLGLDNSRRKIAGIINKILIGKA